jgi:hypothetical protein
MKQKFPVKVDKKSWQLKNDFFEKTNQFGWNVIWPLVSYSFIFGNQESDKNLFKESQNASRCKHIIMNENGMKIILHYDQILIFFKDKKLKCQS